MIPFANIDPGTSTIAAAVIQAIGAIIAAAITGGLAYVIWRWGQETRSVPSDGERVEQLNDEILENSGLDFDDGLPDESITKKRGSFVLLLGPRLVPSRRFVHFSWGGPAGPQAFKIRDYIGGRLLQDCGAPPQPEDGFQIGECPMSRDEVWAAAQKRIPAQGELFHRVQDFPWWKNKLTGMTGGN